MRSVGQKYLNVEFYFLHRRCRSEDGVEPIKTKPVEVRIVVVRHGSPFTACRAQHIKSVGLRCYSSLIRQIPGRILQRIDGSVNPDQSAGEVIILSISMDASKSTFDSDI